MKYGVGTSQISIYEGTHGTDCGHSVPFSAGHTSVGSIFRKFPQNNFFRAGEKTYVGDLGRCHQVLPRESLGTEREKKAALHLREARSSTPNNGAEMKHKKRTPGSVVSTRLKYKTRSL